MADQWYFAKPAPRRGPFTSEQLKELAASGQIQPEDTVWKDGVDTGVSAAKVKHLFDGPQTPDPVRPPAPPRADDPPAHQYSDPDDMELADGEPEPWTPIVENPPDEVDNANRDGRGKSTHQQPEVKKRRVTGVKGGVVISQDGQVVKFRKKCLRCTYADTNVASMPIRSGVTRVNFFCPKCKKNQQVEVQAVG